MDTQPNIVLITVDQMRRDCMGISGHPVVETPNLDMMRKFGVSFTRAYSAVPSCIPARAALLTGLSQRTHGRVGYQDGVPWRYAHTIAGAFSQAGYHTQAIGKMHVFPERNLCGFHHVVLHDGYLHHERNYRRAAQESFTHSDDYLHWLKAQKGVDADIIDSGVECNSWVARPFPYEEKYHPTNWCVSESIDFLRRRDTTKPFFLYTSFVRPHSPLDPPAYYLKLYEDMDLPMPVMGDWAETRDAEAEGLSASARWGRIPKRAMRRAQAAYYGHITHIDHQIGRLFQAMTDYQLMGDTIFLFTSDHGDMLGDHQLFRKSLPYEGSAGVPLLVYDPGDILNAQRNQSIRSLAELRDIMPTLLDMAGVDIPACVEGKSLLPAMRGDDTPIREYIHGEHDMGKYSNHWIVTERDKYIWFSQTGREQYFDLEKDPRELCDAIGDPEAQPRIEWLRERLIAELGGRREGYTDGRRLIVGRPTVTIL